MLLMDLYNHYKSLKEWDTALDILKLILEYDEKALLSGVNSSNAIRESTQGIHVCRTICGFPISISHTVHCMKR